MEVVPLVNDVHAPWSFGSGIGVVGVDSDHT